MEIWPTNLDAIDEQFVQSLVDECVHESRVVEFKAGFEPGSPESPNSSIDGNELRIDVVQFANTVGEHLFF